MWGSKFGKLSRAHLPLLDVRFLTAPCGVSDHTQGAAAP
jgi:hypothetical protein